MIIKNEPFVSAVLPHLQMSEQLVVDRCSLRNLIDFLRKSYSVDNDSGEHIYQAGLEAAYISESNPTSIILFELQQYIQDAQDMLKSTDSEAHELAQMYITSALDMCKKIRKSVKTYI